MKDLTLQEEHAAFQAQMATLLKDSAGKFALVKNGQVVGVFDTHEDAYSKALENFGVDGAFYIGKIEKANPQPISYALAGGVMFGQ